MIDWNDNIIDEMLAAYIDGNAQILTCSNKISNRIILQFRHYK